MSDDPLASDRVSNIFDSLSCLTELHKRQQQKQSDCKQQQQQQQQENLTQNDHNTSQNTINNEHQQQYLQYNNPFQQQNYYIRNPDGNSITLANSAALYAMGHQTFPSTSLQNSQMGSHYTIGSVSACTSPAMSKRSNSLVGCSGNGGGGNLGLNNSTSNGRNTSGQTNQISQSTPNSPRLMPRRTYRSVQIAPPIPAKPNAVMIANPALNALDDGAPWPHFSTLTDHLDVRQVNNYGQPLPEINWQERCLELQLELHRSKNQAGRIRDLLREKVGHFELFLFFRMSFQYFWFEMSI